MSTRQHTNGKNTKLLFCLHFSQWVAWKILS